MIWILAPILALLILVVRAPDVFPARFWAEDLSTFVHAAQWDGATSISQPYAGYLHIIPRIIAYTGTFLPVEVLPVWFSVSTLLVTAWCATIIARSIGGFAGIAASLSLVLASGWSEPIGSITNLQWLIAPTLLALALNSKAISPIEGIVFAAIGSLTGPFSIAFGPIYFFQVARQYLSDRKINWIALIAVMGGIVQFFFVVMTYEASTKTGDPNILYVLRRLLQFAGGGGWVSVAILVSIIAVACFGSGKLDRFFVLAAAGLIAAMAAAKFQYEYQVFSTGEVGQRYWYVPSILFMLCAVLAAKVNKGVIRWLAVVFFVAIPVKDISRSGFVRPWPWVSDNWKDAISQSYIMPVEYHFAPDWKIVLKDGKTVR